MRTIITPGGELPLRVDGHRVRIWATAWHQDLVESDDLQRHGADEHSGDVRKPGVEKRLAQDYDPRQCHPADCRDNQAESQPSARM